VSAEIATRVTDPAAFATAFKRGSEHPRVRTAVNGEYPPDTYPREASLPIASLIGGNGHRFCTGWILKPGQGESMKDAENRRREWDRPTRTELVAAGQGRIRRRGGCRDAHRAVCALPAISAADAR
jgi:hypothetical protein